MLSGTSKADPIGLALARAAQEAAVQDLVILFGSRARGDHRDDSDVDLLVVAGDGNAARAGFAARLGVEKHIESTGVDISTNIISMTKDEFARCRLAKQHVAGQAWVQGVAMAPDRLEYTPNEPDDGYPAHWPATKQRLFNADEHAHAFNDMVGEGFWNQRAVGFFAQQAVENALKGWLSAIDDDRNWDHNLDRLWQGILDKEDWTGLGPAQARESVEALLEHTRYPDPQVSGGIGNWLTNYAAAYRYGGTSYRMTQSERLELQERVNDAVTAIVDRIHALSGTTEADVYPDGLKPWDLTVE